MTHDAKLTEAGTMPVGVQVGDDPKRHRDFVLRLPTVRHNIDATDEVGSHNGVALNAAILARQIVSLGDLKPEQIDFELVASMHPADYNALEDAAARLEKKRMPAAAGASISSESGSLLPAPD